MQRPPDLFDRKNPGYLAREVRRLRQVAKSNHDEERRLARTASRWKLESHRRDVEIRALRNNIIDMEMEAAREQKSRL